ncbi:aldo/keto reductase [Aurantimonas sp. Leaf443]|uniref:aldo/keto reductase n=1 Tax=Aurantimonas sp. Leaf443 TaxID=1736378 RepID=UPI0006FF05AA|nr:aldo/keto reductase [Aurantimonas sp. Leaf443]KQT85387.1 aldo/keto reductase [Aurantimonas sp. Leaf443]
MKKRPLGRTGLMVSEICLGSMTWGSQNDQAEADRQLDAALDAGVNFIDTAEMYPTTPMKAETVGRTEEIIGDWLSRSGKRDGLVLATKITGKGGMARDGAAIDADNLERAVEASLKRLRVETIDLYQLHWPNRGSYHFRQAFDYDPSGRDNAAVLDDMEATLEALGRLVEAGKIAHVGLSNDTAWGTAKFLELAERRGLPRVASLQNEYSLLCRTFDLDLAELSVHEDVGLLAWSPLAAGLLTGKYAGGIVPPGSRASIRSDLGGRFTPHVLAVTDGYVALAREHGLDPAQMAIAFCLTRPFVTAAIIGATSMEQLTVDLGACDLVLPPEVMAGIADLHRRAPMPM